MLNSSELFSRPDRSQPALPLATATGGRVPPRRGTLRARGARWAGVAHRFSRRLARPPRTNVAARRIARPDRRQDVRSRGDFGVPGRRRRYGQRVSDRHFARLGDGGWIRRRVSVAGVGSRAFKARWPGKVVTVLQLAALFALLLRPAVFPALVVLIAIASAWSIADYTLVLHRQRVRS